MEKEKIKIKEKCIEIQERDILDQIKNIDNENNKSWIIIWFVSTIIAFVLRDLNIDNNIILIIFFIISILPIITALLNIRSKSVWYHTNINCFFVKNKKSYEECLNDIHLTYQETYKNISNLLFKKAFLTKLSYIFTILLLTFILYIKLF